MSDAVIAIEGRSSTTSVCGAAIVGQAIVGNTDTTGVRMDNIVSVTPKNKSESYEGRLDA